MYLLDTSIIINYLKNKVEVVELISSFSQLISTSHLCVGELYEGVFREATKEKSRKSEKKILNFIADLDKVWGIDQEIVREFGRIRATLKKAGKVIEDIYIFIAATCITHDLVLVTGNIKHFSRIKGLKIYSF